MSATRELHIHVSISVDVMVLVYSVWKLTTKNLFVVM